MTFYEYDSDIYDDPGLPLHMALNELRDFPEAWDLHWHQAVEFLYCVEGEGTAVSDTRHIPLKAGELAVINPNRLHTFYAAGSCQYYCLLVDPSIWNLPGTAVQPFIADEEAGQQLLEAVKEAEERRPYYQTEVRARLSRLWVYLCRNFPEEAREPDGTGKQLEMVKSVITYIRRNFAEPMTVEDICGAVSFSRSYVCHVFKEITGQTLVEYINFVRCHNADSLLRTGMYNVSECAEKSGFKTLSYFSRTYRKLLGVPPSSHR